MWQSMALVGALASFAVLMFFSDAIRKEVNASLGTTYTSFWNLQGNRIWNEHARLFPASRKRLYLAAAICTTPVFIFTAALLA
jgi:hypothetical protein